MRKNKPSRSFNPEVFGVMQPDVVLEKEKEREKKNRVAVNAVLVRVPASLLGVRLDSKDGFNHLTRSHR